ncbi:unnamed protein product [marine sediment metagenome]|uniref:Radical SAM core domain-containing protein n=1 Tax=marine sediment metagenome TaxID=412755 RepID=X0Y2D9_9ZZZZ
MGWARVSDLLSLIETEYANALLEGISISGGEPFDQPIALRELLIGVRKLGLGILIYTGFTIEELRAMPEAKPCFEPESLVDILVDGPYDESRQVQGELRGSANQRLLILTDRYTSDDLVPPGNLECIVKSDGTIYFTGFHRPSSVG